LRRLDFPYFSTGIDQELPAVTAGDPVTDLDNPDIVKRCGSAVLVVAQRVSVCIVGLLVYAILVTLPTVLGFTVTGGLTSAAIMPLLLRLQ
jgi:hypothetical protein